MKYCFGEIGFEPNGSSTHFEDVEKAAISHSIKVTDSTIAIWNESDEILFIVVNGDVFDKRAGDEIREKSRLLGIKVSELEALIETAETCRAIGDELSEEASLAVDAYQAVLRRNRMVI